MARVIPTADAMLQSYRSLENNDVGPVAVTSFTETAIGDEKQMEADGRDSVAYITKIEAMAAPPEEDESFIPPKYMRYLKIGFAVLCLCAYVVFVVFTFTCNFGSKDSIWVLVLTSFGLIAVSIDAIKFLARHNDGLASFGSAAGEFWNKNHVIIGRIIAGIVAAGLLALVILLAIKEPLNLVSLSGIFGILFICYVLSRHRKRVSWRIVISGVLVHQVIAVIIILIPLGTTIMLEVGSVVEIFFGYGSAGAAFVFGDKYIDHPFAFSVMPALVFFSGVISVLYYYGAAQWVIKKVATGIQFVMGTSPVECVVATGNIFLGQTESALLVQPVLKDVTNSELHAILLSGYATVAGSILAAYLYYGVQASHLIGASLMAAPASLILTNLLYPETEVPKIDNSYLENLGKPDFTNIFHAFSAGASGSIKVVANIIVNLIAFISALALIDGVLTWIGECVCLGTPLTFELICSYLFWPIPLMMGVPPENCFKIAGLIGTKLFINELVAYSKLGIYIDNSEFLRSYNGTVDYVGEDVYLPELNRTLVGGVLDKRSEMIATYALCGFANLGSVGLQIGGVGALVPSRKTDLARLAFAAMLGGNLSSFLSASVAGLYFLQ